MFIKGKICLLLFLWIFFSLVLTRVAHWDSYLHVTVASERPLVAMLRVVTAHGEVTEPVFLGNIRPLDGARHRIAIRNLEPANNNASETRYTTLLSVKNGQRDLNLFNFARRHDVHMHHNYALIHPQGEIAYSGKFRQSELRFALPRYAGKSEIRLNGEPWLSFDYATPFSGQTFDVTVGRHSPQPRSHQIRLPKSRLKSVVLDFGSPQGDFELSAAEYVVHDNNGDPRPGRYKNNSVYPIDPENQAGPHRLAMPEALLEQNHRQHHYLIAAAFFTAAVLALLAYELANLNFRKLWARADLTAVIIICLVSLPVIGAAWVSWPSIMQTDSMSTWAQVKYLEFNTWHSHFYSFIVLSLSLLKDSPSILTVVQALLTIALLSTLYLYLYSKGVRRFLIFGLMVLNLLAVPVFFYPAFFVRDVLYTLLTIFLFLVLAILFFEARRGRALEVRPRHYVYMGVTLGVACLLRTEGLYLIVLAPLFLWALVEKRWPKPLLVFGVSLTVFFAGGAPLKTYLKAYEDPNYRLTLAIEPLGQIVDGHYLSDDYNRDRQIIDKIIAFDDLVKHYRELEAFWSGRHIKFNEFGEVDVDNFVWLARHLALRNPDKFLKNRSRVFFDAISSNTGNVNLLAALMHEGASRWGWHEFERDKFFLGVYDDFLLSDFAFRGQEAASAFLELTMKREGSYLTSLRSYIWSAWPPLLFTLFVMLLWPILKLPALMSVFVLARTLLLFLFQPMAHFKYHYDLYLWAAILLGLVVLELRHLGGLKGIKARFRGLLTRGAMVTAEDGRPSGAAHAQP